MFHKRSIGWCFFLLPPLSANVTFFPETNPLVFLGCVWKVLDDVREDLSDISNLSGLSEMSGLYYGPSRHFTLNHLQYTLLSVIFNSFNIFLQFRSDPTSNHWLGRGGERVKNVPWRPVEKLWNSVSGRRVQLQTALSRWRLGAT